MPTIFQRALDWLAWERLTETKRRHTEILNAMSKINDRLLAIETGLKKASTEITGELAKLREQIENGTPADAAETLDRLDAAAKALDDIVPDAPPAEPAPGAN